MCLRAYCFVASLQLLTLCSSTRHYQCARAAGRAARGALNAKAKAMYYYIGFPILLEKGKLDKAVIA